MRARGRTTQLLALALAVLAAGAARAQAELRFCAP